MLQHIVMPTDGSAESEKPLTFATQLARANDAQLTLMRVVEEMVYTADEDALNTVEMYQQYEQVTQDMARQAQSEVHALAQRLQAEGIRARAEVRRGNPSGDLLDYIDEEHPDLVVMATHGRTGLARFTLGSVADRIIREGSAPVLVTRRSLEATGRLEHGLVMLDGSGVAEEVIPLVTELAGKPFQRLTLYRVVNNPRNQGTATTYLEGVAGQLQDRGATIELKVDVGDARANVERVGKDVDVVILCTHGRTGFDRLRHGSVAEHVIQNIDHPALLVRAGVHKA